jgi:hypothetical protein
LIRSVATIRIRPGTTDAQIDAFAAAVRALETEGMTARTLGRDLGLREQAVDFAIVLDFADEAAYRRYDTDPDHVRLRAGLAAEVVESASICQFAIA